MEPRRDIPPTIDTACSPLNAAWERYAVDLMSGCGLCVADTDRALNWDAFLGRSISFTRLPGDVRNSGAAPDFTPLLDRGLRLRDLAELWKIQPLRDHFMHRDEPSEPAAASCSMLLRSGGPAGEMLCDAFQSLPKSSSHWSVRALLQNSAALEEYNYSFRAWLRHEISAMGETEFPPKDFRKMVLTTNPSGVAQYTLEEAIRMLMGRVFHRANPVIAAHILCDWQLGLWYEGKTEVFDLFPIDTHHASFVSACSAALPEGEAAFAQWWHAQPGCADLPPRLASACMSCAQSGVG